MCLRSTDPKVYAVTEWPDRHADFEPGNDLAVRHGAYSPKLVDEDAAGLVGWLKHEYPHLAGGRFDVVLWNFARVQVQVERASAWLLEQGWLTKGGQPKHVHQDLRLWLRLAAELARELGISPAAAASVERDLAAAGHRGGFDPRVHVGAARRRGIRLLQPGPARRSAIEAARDSGLLDPAAPDDQALLAELEEPTAVDDIDDVPDAAATDTDEPADDDGDDDDQADDDGTLYLTDALNMGEVSDAPNPDVVQVEPHELGAFGGGAIPFCGRCGVRMYDPNRDPQRHDAELCERIRNLSAAMDDDDRPIRYPNY